MLFRRAHITVSGEGERHLLQAVIGMIEEDDGVEATAVELCLEMQMLRRCTTSAPCKSDYLSGSYLLARLHEVLRLMTIQSLQSVGMLHDDAVAISREWTRAHHLAIECHMYAVVGPRLQVKVSVTCCKL